jgi:hypothetical protein
MKINCPDISHQDPHPEKTDYALLTYLTTLFSHKTIIILGTHPEEIANQLSKNPTNTVIPFSPISFSPTKENVKNPIIIIDSFLPLLDDPTHKQTILDSALIYIDIHPHEGTEEYKIYTILRESGYCGIILYDDIWHFKTMRDHFWYKIPQHHKYDLTEYGHWSGSGLVYFNPTIEINPPMFNNDNWTLITSYFNLTKCPDASPEIHKRDKNYYFEHCVSTLSLPYNMIIYCDQESFSQIVQIRPVEFVLKTQYVILPFDSFRFDKGTDKGTFRQYREKIIENRVSHPYEFDPRNTASYYLFCMSRYIAIKEVIEINPFKSTHFAWINFCMERMGIENIRKLPEALSLNREKFSTCYIDYIPEEFVVENDAQYFKRGLCSMCSGFFTGNAQYMYNVCDSMENKFLYYLERGYGHSDETLFPSVYFENTDWFEHYYGDYQQMITNYCGIVENPDSPLRNFIKNSFQCGDFERCFRACLVLWDSYTKGKCALSREQLEKLCFYYMMCQKQLISQ